ncbi:MAG: NAD(P)H-hydrate dehydratase [Parachlamydiales bacterium]|nr:NAD(P)H-hydrate dehydratase [Parachlamydiales bacterium]
MDGIKVVSGEEMRRIESLAYEEGHLAEDFMENAGRAVAEAIIDWMQRFSLSSEIIFLVGKGNNGGDGYVAARILHAQNYSVRVYALFPEEDTSSLCQKKAQEYFLENGKGQYISKVEDFSCNGIIVDAILGTGFKGKVEGFLHDVIAKVNDSNSFVVAVDIPSGVDATTGAVDPIAIKADLTVSLGLLKTGFYLQKGYDYVGKVILKDFGLPQKFVESAQEEFLLPLEDLFASLLPEIVPTRHKYNTGSITAIAGSDGLMGAAFLSSLGALRSGAGIVFLYANTSTPAKSGLAPEVLYFSLPSLPLKSVIEKCNQSHVVYIGPGLGRDEKMKKVFKDLMSAIKVPLVLDADALYFWSQDLSIPIPPHTIITPHKKEMLRLLQEETTPANFIGQCRQFAENYSVHVVLKGAVTFIFSPGNKPYIFPWGDPGMATAGVGDVLTGVISALLAQGLDSQKAASLGVYLHSLAGKYAAQEFGSYSMIASDLIGCLPKGFQSILQRE